MIKVKNAKFNKNPGLKSSLKSISFQSKAKEDTAFHVQFVTVTVLCSV